MVAVMAADNDGERLMSMNLTSLTDEPRHPTTGRSVIHHGILITMDPSYTIHDPGMVVIEHGIIIQAGPEDPAIVERIAPEHRIDARGSMILPGLINTHTHIGMSLFRTLADDTADRLRKIIFPLERQFVTPELVYWASLHALSEMIRGGTTTFADMYYFAEQTARATHLAGLRAIVGESLMHDPSPDAAGFAEGLELCRQLADSWTDSPLIIPGLAPHAPYSLTREELETTAALSHEGRLPILSHLAEMPFEETLIRQRHGMSPIAFYDSCGMLSPQATMAHCIFAGEEDRALLIQRETGIAHNVCANSKSGKGIAPAYEFYTAGARIGLGTDGPMSGNTLDIVHQLRPVSLFQKTRLQDPTIMTPRQVVEMATIGGARALHLEQTTGSLEAGKSADIILVSVEDPAMYPIYDPYAALVYGASPSDVTTVVAAGGVVMQDRVLTTLDTTAIRSGAASFVERIRRDVGSQ